MVSVDEQEVGCFDSCFSATYPDFLGILGKLIYNKIVFIHVNELGYSIF